MPHVDTFAASNIQHTVREARAVAVEAEHRKRAKYQALTHTHIFTSVSVETSGACGPEALSLFRVLKRQSIVGRVFGITPTYLIAHKEKYVWLTQTSGKAGL